MNVPNVVTTAGFSLASGIAAFWAAETLAPAPKLPTAAPQCITAVEVFYSNERTAGAIDTVLWVPPSGSVRDSLLRADSLNNGAILPDVAQSSLSPRVQVCELDTAAKFRPVLKT